MQRRLVIANRGEIARRILKTGRARGYLVAAISSTSDAHSLIRREVDEVLEVSSFLAKEEIAKRALEWRADLIHPGYGFLSENSVFASLIEKAGITFIGPTAHSMKLLGSKESAKEIAKRCGVPLLPSLSSDEISSLSPTILKKLLKERGLFSPLLVKASGGGGGRGMRVVQNIGELPEALNRASEEAKASFGDSAVFIERYLEPARHIEIQVFGDGKGGGVFLGERECSLQRRHQKVLEEAPSPFVTPTLRKALGESALALVREVSYRGAGTVEFLVDKSRQFYFLEVNTRLQVEHPVTEMVYGIDLVDAQCELAEGRWPKALPSPRRFSIPEPKGSAIEVRVLAEDPSQHFLPTPGPLLLYQEPKGTDIRVDSGVQEGDTISAEFDSMIAKVIVHGSSRKEALNRLAGALADFTIHGCTTNIPFLRKLVRHPHVLQGELSTSWIGDHLETLIKESEDIALSEMILSPQFWCEISHSYENPSRSSLTGALFKSLDGTHWSNRTRQILQLQEKRGPNRFFKFVEDRSALAITQITPTSYALSTPKGMRLVDRAQQGSTSLDPSHGKLEAPMSGKVIEIRAKIGSLVGRGDTVFVIESMKMQLEIKAPVAGKVSVITTALGSTVAARELLAEITP